MPARLRGAWALLAICAALAGCGDEEGRVDVSGDSAGGDQTGATGADTGETGTTASPAAPAGKPVATVKVRETEYELFPQDPDVGKTGVVAFKITNAGTVVHALEVEGPEGEQESERLQPGKSTTLKVDLGKAGRFEWYCPVADHKDRGMKGEITVAGGGGAKPEDKSGSSGGY